MIERLPPAQRRAAAFVLAVTLAAAAYAVLVRPVLEAHRALDSRTADTQAQLARYRSVAHERPAYERAFELHQRADLARPHYLSGRNAALASAQLQGLVKRAVEAGGGELVSLQMLASPRSDAPGEIVVRARARGDARMVQRLLHALESGSPILLVDNLFVDASSAREDAKLTVTLDVAARTRERAP